MSYKRFDIIIEACNRLKLPLKIFGSGPVLEDLKKRFKYIVVFFDNDKTGIINMIKLKKFHPELNFFFIPRNFNAKDFSDFYALYGRGRTLEEIKKYIRVLKKFGRKNFGD